MSPRTLRTKLQLLALVLVVVPGVLVALIAAARARSALETAAGQQLAEIAHDTLDEVTEALAGQRSALRTWARQDVMRDLVVDDIDKRIGRFLRSLVEGGAPYRRLACVDRTGRIVASSDPGDLGADVGGEAWARAALGGEDFVRGPLAVPDEPPSAVVELAVPIRDPEEGDAVAGALVGTLRWEHPMALATRIRQTLLPHGMTVDLLIVDREGRVVGTSWRDGLDPATEATLAGVAAAIARDLPRGRDRGWMARVDAGVLVGWERSRDATLGGVALVTEPLAEALGPVHALRRRLAVMLAVVLAGGLAFATLLAERMSRPLRALTRATQAIAHGGAPRQPVTVRSRDEIGALATAFNAMTDELTRAQEDLLVAAKFAFVGEVAAGVAHELRTPLGILRSSAQMLERTLPPGQAQATELAGMMVEEVDRLDRVVDGLLTLARPHEPVIESTSLATVLARALDFVQGQAQEKGVTLLRDFTADPGPARCDPEQIYQVALNLVVNALQTIGAGGTIRVRTLPAGARVAFEVTDTGPGIPPELHDRIFLPFFSQRQGGTGLGLALVQRVVQAHQGTVSVDSAVGRGATFRVELPAWDGVA